MSKGLQVSFILAANFTCDVTARGFMASWKMIWRKGARSVLTPTQDPIFSSFLPRISMGLRIAKRPVSLLCVRTSRNH